MKAKETIQEVLDIFEKNQAQLDKLFLLTRGKDYIFDNCTLREFILKFFPNDYSLKRTYNAKTGYLHKEFTGRSHLDIYRLCKYYFPHTTLIEVTLLLYKLAKERRLYTWVCATSCRRMYNYHNGAGTTLRNKDNGDGMKLIIQDYKNLQDYLDNKNHEKV